MNGVNFYSRKIPIPVAIGLVMICFSTMSHARLFGIPAIVVERTPLQVSPGWGTTVIAHLFPEASVLVLCKSEDPSAGYHPASGRPWWLKVHVWSSGMEGWVPDVGAIRCRHGRPHGSCNIPFCVYPLSMSEPGVSD